MGDTALTGSVPSSQVDTSEEEDARRALDLLLAHKKAFTQDFLRARGLAFSGTRERLRERVMAYLADGRLTLADLVRLLDRIEGWGNQHVYLYRASDRLLERWADRAAVERHLADLGLGDLLNQERPLVLPEETALSTIEWGPERARLVWVERREWEERVSAYDIVEEKMVWRAYRRNVSRALIAFDWDLVSGDGALSIQRLPRGSQYRSIRDRFEAELDPLIGLRQFERVRISRAIHRIEASGEVRRRRVAYQTRRGSRATFTSAGRYHDAFADPDLAQAGIALGEGIAGVEGNFYWLPVAGKLESAVYTKLYQSDQRVGILGEHPEQDVRYVLSRIRHYCR